MLPSSSRDGSRASTPLGRSDTLDGGGGHLNLSTGPGGSMPPKQQFDLRRIGQGIRVGVRLFGRDGSL